MPHMRPATPDDRGFGDEEAAVFVGRVLLAFVALLALAAMVAAMVALAYFSAPSEKRTPPIRGSAEVTQPA